MIRAKVSHQLSQFDVLASVAIRIVRLRHPPMSRFAAELGRRLGRSPLTRQAIYSWESGRTRVPACVLLAVAELQGTTIDELVHAAHDWVTPAGRVPDVAAGHDQDAVAPSQDVA